MDVTVDRFSIEDGLESVFAGEKRVLLLGVNMVDNGTELLFRLFSNKDYMRVCLDSTSEGYSVRSSEKHTVESPYGEMTQSFIGMNINVAIRTLALAHKASSGVYHAFHR